MTHLTVKYLKIREISEQLCHKMYTIINIELHTFYYVPFKESHSI